VAVAVGTPTATPALVGDYPTLVRPRVERVEQGLNQLHQHLGTLRTNPLRMAEQDWRNQAFGILDELAAANRDLRALGVRVGPDASLSGEVTKLVTDLEFVVEEYRSALADDPDGSHFARAGRAETTTAQEIESILFSLRRPVGRAPTLTPAR
jgi:hypothetical protein